ncbi:hypothetical protein [Polyangium mundeleinium]|uniref:Uncharacterized protein n=1 Tax=Polyangium mundeleinium TaxID=2995306 RepID=A0ABT5EYL8_9BACT|nr:hypothetical protein [Polyangium mundeleinium]MDC0746927.1 hypothetical protein [Polyangium mundeleinium]
MPVQSHRRPELRASVVKLLETLVPAVRDGGEVPLLSIVQSVAGDRLKPEVQKHLEARGNAVFRREGTTMTFSNEGPALRIPLKRFDLRIAARVTGEARLVEGGATLRFRGAETLSASKFLFSVRLEGIEATDQRILVDMEGDSFDQVFELV